MINIKKHSSTIFIYLRMIRRYFSFFLPHFPSLFQHPIPFSFLPFSTLLSFSLFSFLFFPFFFVHLLLSFFPFLLPFSSHSSILFFSFLFVASSSFFLSLFKPLYLLMFPFVLHHYVMQSHDIFEI